MWFANCLVASLDFCEEGIEPIWKRMSAGIQDCEHAIRLQNARGPLVAHFLVEPMPAVGGEYHVEQRVPRLPRFEGGRNHLDARQRLEIATGDSSEIRAELDADNAASATREMTRSVTRTASELQNEGVAFETGKREKIVEDLIGAIGTSPVIKLGDLIEGPFQLVAISVGHRIQNSG